MAGLDPVIAALFVILGFNCLCKVEAQAKSASTTKEWNHWFDYIFVDVEGPYTLSAIMTTLMRLHEHMPAAVDTTRKEIVEFWHDAVMDKQEHCTFEYLSTLKEEQKKYLDSGYKKDSIYDFVYRKVIKNCMYRFLKGVKRAKSLNPDEESLVNQLGSIWIMEKRGKCLPGMIGESKEDAAKLIRSTIPAAARQNKEDFVEAWRREGACRKLLTELEGPTMELEKFYKEFDVGYKSFQYDTNSAYEWVKVLEGCKYFMKDQPLYGIWLYVAKS